MFGMNHQITFRGLKFHELSTYAKFVEFKYLKKHQLYSITMCHQIFQSYDVLCHTLFFMLHFLVKIESFCNHKWFWLQVHMQCFH